VGVRLPNRTDMRGGSSIKKKARALRGNMPDAEQVLWKELRKYRLGRRFRRQFPIPPYIVDFACVEARLIVEADGGQHARPGDHELRDRELRRRGWRILQFWNNEILANPQGVLRTIAEALGRPRERSSPHPDPPPLAGEGVSTEGA
jgi:very-short-patch-repair endonuclease